MGGRGPARYARTYFVTSRRGERQTRVRDVIILEEVPPSLISPLVTGTEPVDPSTYVTFSRPWTQALERHTKGYSV